MGPSRCLSSSVLKLHREEYAPFLSPEYPTIDQYCATEVDPMYREADQLPIVALSRYEADDYLLASTTPLY